MGVGWELEFRQRCSNVSLLVGEVWLLLHPEVTIALSGCVECELSNPAFGVVKVGGNGFVWCFTDLCGGNMEGQTASFVGSDEGGVEESFE